MEVSQRSAPTRAPTDVPARFSVDDRVWLVGIVLLAAALRFVAIGQHWGTGARPAAASIAAGYAALHLATALVRRVRVRQ